MCGFGSGKRALSGLALTTHLQLPPSDLPQISTQSGQLLFSRKSGTNLCVLWIHYPSYRHHGRQQTGQDGMSASPFVQLSTNFLIAKSRKLFPSAKSRPLLNVQINYRMRVTLNDGRQMTGQMLAFDKVRAISLGIPGSS